MRLGCTAIVTCVSDAVTSPGATLELPWLLFGSYLESDETAKIFLFFTSLLWSVAGIYSTAYFSEGRSRARFFICFLLAMAGNLGLILAQDMVLFYAFFALMSSASYGLAVHERTHEALRAGRIYIVLVVVVLSPRFIPFSDLKYFWSIKIMTSALWPVALGSILAFIVWLISKRRRARLRFSIPSGDILIIVEKWLWPALRYGLSFCVAALEKGYSSLLASVNGCTYHLALISLLGAGENRFSQWVIGTTLFFILVMAFVFLASQSIL